MRNRYFDKSLPDAETVLTAEDFQRAQRQRRQSDDNFVQTVPIDDSAMYNESRFEGDIVNPGLLRILPNNETDDGKVAMPGLQHNAVRQPYLKWPSAIIPYTVSQQYLLYGRDQIVQAIDEYSTKTCIKFRPKTASDMDYIHIFPDDGCYSLVGKVGGKQPVSLGDGCMSKGIIIHELMHAVGFFHEQSRTDRDNYVNIKWDNIDQNLRDQFDKYSQNMIDFLGTQYDFGSVMHYGPYAFTKNGKPTIQPKQPGKTIGQRIGFSQNDLYKINRLYACPNTPQMPPSDSSVQPVDSSALTAAANGAPTAISDRNVNNANCIDQRSDCPFLASIGNCESVFSTSFMLVHCARTCRKCGGINDNASSSSAQQCDDQLPMCRRWAANGLCELFIFQQYLLNNCALSCGGC
ncbi:hypothetical protein niasHS_002897 [Heterodera schachtii]|uniref:Metalloendopeptidase n=1 Tax=Heterodera schachtii TaxID=97005 RepID=A0ABD2K947_HETSC